MSKMLTKKGMRQSLAYAMHAARHEQERIWRLQDMLDEKDERLAAQERQLQEAAADGSTDFIRGQLDETNARLLNLSAALRTVRRRIEKLRHALAPGAPMSGPDWNGLLCEMLDLTTYGDVCADTDFTVQVMGFEAWKEVRTGLGNTDHRLDLDKGPVPAESPTEREDRFIEQRYGGWGTGGDIPILAAKVEDTRE